MMPISSSRRGPLAGIRVVELVGIGPAPFAAMMLADLGATVISIDRTVASDLGVRMDPSADIVRRGRPAILANLKHQGAVALVLDMVERADALIEGFRPGVMERLGLGPEPCLARNPRLAYGRVTGWGQTGPAAQRAGHDLNYIGLTGALDSIGPAGGPPVMPLNLLGDYAGGSLYLLVGILATIINARVSGTGQVVDAAMVDGAANLMTIFYGLQAAGQHNGPRGTNELDGGKPWYRVYRCADGKYLSFAALEKKFRSIFCVAIGWPADALDVSGAAAEAAMGQRLEALFLEKGRDEWCRLLGSVDACVAPVLSTCEAPVHQWNAERGVFVTVDDVVQPAPAPRFSVTPAAPPATVPSPGDGFEAALAEWGIGRDRIDGLIRTGALVATR
jgi:alpha-methylacyl-CoA racemase